MNVSRICKRCGKQFVTYGQDLNYCGDCRFLLGLQDIWVMIPCSPDDPECDCDERDCFKWVKKERQCWIEDPEVIKQISKVFGPKRGMSKEEREALARQFNG